MKKQIAFNTALAAMFLAIGYVLPLFTGQIQQIGNMLLPMHVPVMLCGLICGWKYGLAVGFIMPITRSFIFGMPMLYPNAVGMAFELAVYGFTVGFLFSLSKRKCIISLYVSLICAMLAGRAVWGMAMIVLLGIKGSVFTFSAFLAGAFLNAFPGIIIQLVLIPATMLVLDRTHLIKFNRCKPKTTADAAQ